MAALAVSIAGCPGGDDGAASTGGPEDSSTAAPGDATLPDPTASSTMAATGDSTGGGMTAPPSDSSSEGGSSGSESGEPSTGSGSSSSTGEGVTATPCQGEPLVHVPELTRFAWPATSPTPATNGDLQDDPDPFGGGGFIEVPDGGGVNFECDPIAQDCPPGEKCMPWANDGGPSWNATRCVDIAADPGAVGDSCTVEGSGVSGIDDCELGAMCFNVDTETGVGTCIEMCSGSIDAPVCDTPGTACVITNDGALTICQSVCNPLAAECPPGQGCYLVGELTVCGPDASNDLGAAGDPCEYINACDDGNACLGAATVPDCASGVGCCSPFCTIGDDSTCLDGQTCSPVYPAGQAPLECVADLGLCVLP